MKKRNLNNIILNIIVLSFLPSVSFAGMGKWPLMDTNCNIFSHSSSSKDKKAVDSLIAEHYSSSEDELVKILKNPLIIKNKEYTAYKLCTNINDQRNGDATIAGFNGVRILSKKILPALGVQRQIIKQALPVLAFISVPTLRFEDDSCHIFGDYEYAICVKTEGRVAIDEQYERYKRKHGIAQDSHVKTIDYKLVEIEISNSAGYYERAKFLDCGPVTWGECKNRKHSNNTANFMLNNKKVEFSLLSARELDGICFKFTTTYP